MTDPLSRHTDYGQQPLLETEVLGDPIAQLRLWIGQADESSVYEPNAMVLSTIDPDGLPSSRTVLLRELDAHGLEFFTNYGSEKGLALLAHPEVSVVFPWYAIHRQVIVRGVAQPTNAAVSDAYFATRPLDSRIGAWASPQSEVVMSRAVLVANAAKFGAKFLLQPQPRLRDRVCKHLGLEQRLLPVVGVAREGIGHFMVSTSMTKR